MKKRLICQHWRANVDMQIILDVQSAISYMVKYATKGEKAGASMNQIFRDVIGKADVTDNANTKFRSILLKSIAGTRDIGQCEVTRLILGDPLYHSSFTYVKQSLDLYEREINMEEEDDQQPATKKNMMDFYANRHKEPFLISHVTTIKHFLDFVTRFTLLKGKIVLRPKPEKTVVITNPKCRYNPKDIESHKKYCYYQMIKYSDWKKEDIPTLNNFDDAIERWDLFIKTASKDVLDTL